MPIWRSDRARLYAGEESTFGTNPAGTKSLMGGLVRDVELSPPVIEWLQYPAVGTDRHTAVAVRGQRSMAEIRFPVILQNPKIFSYIFEGTKTNVNTPQASTNTHIYSPVGAESTKGDLSDTLVDSRSQPLKSFSLEASYEDPTAGGTTHAVRSYTGCKIASAEFSMDSAGELIATLNTTAMGVFTSNTRSSTTDINRTTRPYLFSDATVKLFGNDATQNGTTGIMTMVGTTTFNRVTEFNLTVENNLTQRWYLTTESGSKTGDASASVAGPRGGQYVYDLVPGKRDITLTMGMILADSAGDGDGSLVITSNAAGANTIWGRMEGTGTTPFDIELKLARTATTDEIRFQLFDAWITRAPHTIPEDKADVPIDIEFGARKMRVEVANNVTAANMTFNVT